MADSGHRGSKRDVPEVSVGIVLLNYCSLDTALDACRRYVSFRLVRMVILVDNASPDGSWRRLVKENVTGQMPKVVTLLNDCNSGYGAGNNVGIARCLSEGVDYVLVVNPDVVLLEFQLNSLVDRLSSSSVGFVSPMLLLEGDPPEVDCLGGVWDAWIGRGIQHLAGISHEWLLSNPKSPPISSRRYRVTPAGACMLFKNEAISALGMLPEDTFLFGEEVLLAEKARRLGIEFALEPSVWATHLRGLTTGSSQDVESRSPTALYHSSRSSLIIGAAIWPRRRLVYLACRLLWASMLSMRGHSMEAGHIARGALSGLRAGRQARYMR